MKPILSDIYRPAAEAFPRPGSVPVSVTVITKNEALNIADCLASVAFAAQVVVVDAQSTDATAAIAREWGADVHVRPWPGFTEQRNFSIDQCHYDWILSIDADERVTQELAEEIDRVMKEGPCFSGYRVPELNNYFGRWLRHGGIYPGHHVSLFDRRQGIYQSGMADVHEDVQFKVTGLLSGHVLHFAYPNFSLALKKLNRYTDLEAQGRLEKGAKAGFYGILFRPAERFVKNYFFKRGFLDGIQGFLYCFLSAFYAFVTGVKIWELEGRRRAQARKAEGQVVPFPKAKALAENDLKTRKRNENLF
jgi:glycosyltransferase involved in cell wall biosynthesis